MPPPRALPADDVAGLLRQWSDAQLDALDALDLPVEPAARAGTVLRPPAAEAQVAAAEQRLGVRLPPSYRDFLLLSDGAYADTIGAVVAAGVREGDPDDAWGFLPVSEVRWFVDVEPATVDIWLQVQREVDEMGLDQDPAPLFEGDEVRDHRPLRDALLIARGIDANCSLLVPVGSPAAGDEWEVWDHHKEGSTRWSSFRAYLADTVEHHLGVDVDEADVLLLLADAERGDARAARRLARVRSPGATPLLLDAARRGAVLLAVTSALARIGGHDVVAALIDLPPAGRQQAFVNRALALIGTPAALDHLADVGDFHQLSRVGDPRAAEIALAHLREDDSTTSAARLLARLPDPRWVPDLLDAYDRQSGDETRVSILGAMAECGAFEEVRRRAPDLLDGPYGYVARSLLTRTDGTTDGAAPL
ncbi:SMI1/KNR4 family protein [Nocardioides sediminis]|uniref:SMI1/KNR4 family protein n=1 Tax=Nocardioides sediminis TaxID=433648 RepID=UPI001901CB23|nr:SMI1/KNR4 family protein [Nocardioides sediminis]